MAYAICGSPLEAIETLATPDQLIVATLDGALDVESYSGSVWNKVVYQAGSIGMSFGGQTEQIRWSDRGGKSVFAGQPFGSELAWSGVVSVANFEAAETDAQMSMYGGNFFRNFVYQNRKWSFKNLDLDKTLADARDIGEIMNATDASFKGFKARGGKLIAFAGLADSIVTPLSSVHYYQSVVAAQDPSPATALAKTQEFYRLFLAPGVGHCGGGPGPNEFGQTGGAGDAEHDLVVALERWVEQGVPPTHIIATKFSGDDHAKGVAMTRPLCPFPQVAKYSGSGDSAEAKNFACVD